MTMLQNARRSMRTAYDNADSHRQFAHMFAAADMIDAANYHLDKASGQSAVAGLYESILFSLMAES